MRRAARVWGVAAGLLVAAAQAAAQGLSPVGLWKTIDDESKTEKSLVRISEGPGGLVSGKLEKLLDPAAKADARCEKCEDERKNLPIVGLTILRNLHQDPDDKGLWLGGDVLDPGNGKVYRARLKPVDGGRKLELRGYLGPFYRTQVWLRVE